MNIHDAIDAANEAAGDGPGWNARYREALRTAGFTIFELQGNNAPEGCIRAPRPFPNDPDPWPETAIIVRLHGS